MVFNFYTFNVDDDEDLPNNFPGYPGSPSSSFSESSTDQACVGCMGMLSSAAPAPKNSSPHQPRQPQFIPGDLEPHSSSSSQPNHACSNGKQMHSFELPAPQNQRKNNHSETEFHFDHVDASRYKALEIIGKGSSGVVCSASDIHTGKKVAIKKISNIFEHLPNAIQVLREIKLYRLLRHPDIVEIKHILLPFKRDFQDIYMVFELMESDLHQVIEANDDLGKEHYQFFLYQLLRALKYIHTANVIHRDIKPKNILANANCKLKICDFGLARVAFNDNPTPIFWTDYVAARWYRAPELCGSFYSKYTPAIDIWSIGCIFAELLNGKPLFPGKSVVHQLDLITDLLGTPSIDAISRVRNEKARRYLTSMRKKKSIPFEKKFPNADPLALRLLEKLLAFEPNDRPSAEEALAHPYFKGLAKIEREPSCQPIKEMEFEFDTRRVTEEDIRELIFREILEYHPQPLKDYLNGTTGTNFLYPSTMIHSNPLPSKEQQKVSSYRDPSTSEETKNRNSRDVELASSSKTAERTQRIATATFSVNNNIVTIEMLTRSNFKKWKQDVEHAIKMANVDLAMVADKPSEISESSTNSEKQIHAAWWKSNRMCYQIMKRTIPENLLNDLPSTTEAKDFLTVVTQRYKTSSNAEIDTLLRELYSMRYDGVGGIREYIIEMVECQTKLKALNIVLPDACIVHQVLNTLPADYGLFVATYNSQDMAWGINDLITKCIAEEEKLKSEKSPAAFSISKPMDKGKGRIPKFSTDQSV